MVKPVVSIVLPVYNGEKYLAISLESVLALTYQDWELIIVDDCSKDSTPQIIAKYAALDPRIKPIRNVQNKRLPASLNVGFKAAQGKYFTWTSDDNIFRPTALQEMVDVLEKDPSIGLVYADYTRIDDDGQAVEKVDVIDTDNILLDSIGACFLYRREVDARNGGYAEDLFLVEDYDFWLRAYQYFKFYHIKKDLYMYRVHNQRLSVTREMERYGVLIKMHLKHASQGYFASPKQRVRLYLKVFYSRKIQKMYGEAFKYLLLAFLRSPWQFALFFSGRALIKIKDKLNLK